MPEVTKADQPPGQPPQVVPAGGPVPPVKPSPKKDVDPASIKADMPMACYFCENGEWLPGKVLSITGSDRSAVAFVAAGDGRIVIASTADIRHGTDKPLSQPALQSILPGGLRRSTVRPHQGKWLVASPDGIVRGEHDTEEDANAHLLKVDLPAGQSAEAVKKTG